ncbi:unnamed protein product [Adineta ricciae]|uniref:Uncharacterized protein n=1 Tax=Adineta ricciae TaxID=249248 RepID=A0A813YNR5_ADIRI|nr:unnamed protein product [Adineta ricciae]CAF1410103.1 unnamed protein product [Adineta ricciae]
MASGSFRLTHKIKYVFTAAFTAFLTSNCVSSYEQIPSTYESDTGLKFPESVIDLACLTNTFPSKYKLVANESQICSTRLFNNYKEIKQINGLVYDHTDESFISNTYPSLGIKGLHVKVFERNQYVFIVVRHQEHESILTDEMNEMMSLFGAAATVDRQRGNKEAFGASVVASMIRSVRQRLGLDYLPQAIAIFNQVQSHYKDRANVKYVFSGFSAGGLYAIVLGLYFNWPAITFSATGVDDIVNIYYSDLFASQTKQGNISPIYNFAHILDPIPKLDCQLGVLCLYTPENLDKNQQFTEKELESLHISTIYGQSDPAIIQWLGQLQQWTCSPADHYNFKYGSCKRERLRWEDRVKSNSVSKQRTENEL